MIDSSRLYLTFVALCLLSVIPKQWLEQYNYSDVQSALMTGFRILRQQYGISVAESQTFLLAKRPPAAMSEEKRLFSQAILSPSFIFSWTTIPNISVYFKFIV